MIYLDGSRFFFDIEAQFSKLVEREKASTEKPDTEMLCNSIAKFTGAKKEFIRVSDSVESILSDAFPEPRKILTLSCDYAADAAGKAFMDSDILIFGKNEELKFKASELAAKAEEEKCDLIIFSNPCFPTSLSVSDVEIKELLGSTSATVIVDESHIVDSDSSIFRLCNDYDNLIVVRKNRFAGGIVTAAGQGLPKLDAKGTDAQLKTSAVIFEHSSAIRTGDKKLQGSIDSLYIRMKKLAIKYDSIERLYRTKADFVYLSVSESKKRAVLLSERGIEVGSDEGHLCISAGSSEENEAVLAALCEIL